ncbi:MAG: DNA polymerase III subunit beta [Chitinophagaceae bacterium]
MKFIVSSNALSKQLQVINGAIASKSVLPILDNFLFVLENKSLSVMATDLETVIKAKVEVTTADEGKICIPSKILLEYLKNIADQPITFNIDIKKFSIEIKSDSGKYKLIGEDAKNYPKEPEFNEVKSLKLSATMLIETINTTLFAVSSDNLRLNLTGLFFELSQKEGLRFVATDAHRLVCDYHKDIVCAEDTSFIVPKKPLQLLKVALPDIDEEVNLSYNTTHFFVRHTDVELACRLVDSKFPDYRNVIPAQNPFNLKVNRELFISALRRINIFSNKSTHMIVMNIVGSELNIKGEDTDFSFEGNEKMNCDYKGDELKIAFNGKFLVEMLSALTCEDVMAHFSTPNKPCIINPIQENQPNKDLTMLLMPLLINNK